VRTSAVRKMMDLLGNHMISDLTENSRQTGNTYIPNDFILTSYDCKTKLETTILNQVSIVGKN